MLAPHSAGTQTAVISTEHTLATVATAAVFILQLDLSNMLLGDYVEVVVKVRQTSGGAYKQQSYSLYAHSQADVIQQSVPIVAPYGAEFTLKQTAGTGRDFPWLVATL
jgi:hypothetical protein